ncbi:MAG: hypothetical protein EXS17_04995 [Phycisphaerales bacterium]|nr:hypothetical protein [Phycisphaerales bacterium]
MKNRSIAAVASLSLAVTAVGAHATLIPPTFGFSLHSAGSTINGSAGDFGSTTNVSPTEWFFQGSCSAMTGTSMNWAYLVDPDPFITGSLSITNESLIERSYIVDFSLGITPPMSGSLVSGQVSGSLTDSNGSGGALLTSTAGGAVYTALADDVFVRSLMSNASHAVSNQYGTTSFSGGSFGQPTAIAGPAINNTIGIRYAFTLSAGDSVSFSSIFVANVPAPGVMALGFFAGAFTRSGRRRMR